MNELWEYMPKNLLTIRGINFRNGDKPYSLIDDANIVWPKSGYMQAICHPFYKPLGFTRHTFRVPYEKCTCGIYGCFSLHCLLASNTTIRDGYAPYLLIEAFGKNIVQENGVLRMAAAQVVATVSGGISTSETQKASEYFNVPTIEPDKAQEMISAQMKEWNIKLSIGV